MSNNTDTPAFLEIHPILTSTITQYFHPLPFIGQYFSTPLSNPLPHSSLYIPTLPCSSTEPPTCERKSPAPELHPKAPYLTPQRRRLPEAERWDFRACCTWRSRFACCSDAADSPSDPPSVSRTTTPATFLLGGRRVIVPAQEPPLSMWTLSGAGRLVRGPLYEAVKCGCDVGVMGF